MFPYKSALKNSLTAIKTHKSLLLTIFLIQIAFLIVISFVNVKYQPAIVQNIQDIIIPLQTANYDDQAIAAGIPFLENVAAIYSSFQQMLENIWKLFLYSLLAFILINGWNWVLTHYMFKSQKSKISQTKQNILKLFGNIALSALIFIIPAAIIIYQIITSAFTAEQSNLMTQIYISFAVAAVAAYFMLISFARADQKINLKIVFKLGIKKAPIILLTMAINIAIVALTIYLTNKALLWPFSAMVFFVLLFIAAIILTRIFFVAVVKELE